MGFASDASSLQHAFPARKSNRLTCKEAPCCSRLHKTPAFFTLVLPGPEKGGGSREKSLHLPCFTWFLCCQGKGIITIKAPCFEFSICEVCGFQSFLSNSTPPPALSLTPAQLAAGIKKKNPQQKTNTKEQLSAVGPALGGAGCLCHQPRVCIPFQGQRQGFVFFLVTLVRMESPSYPRAVRRTGGRNWGSVIFRAK